MKQFFKTALLTAPLVVLATAFGFSQQTYWPGKGGDWQIKKPELYGLSSAQLQKAIEFAQANEYSGSKDLRVATLESFSKEPYHELVGPTKKRGGPAGLILKNGYIVAQWGDVKRVDMTFSATKSYLSTMAGLAVDEGHIADVHDKVADYVWDGTYAGEHNAKISWHHLLTQSSDWSGDLFGMSDWSDRPANKGGIDEWKNRELLEPGANFEYNDVRVNLLAYSLLQVLRKPLPMVLKEKIMDPIGASATWRWYGYENSFVNVDGVMVQSVSGGGHSGGGLFISTLDHARYGLLFLREGNWNGRQLLSKKWVEMVQQSSQANESYGYLWWLNRGPRKWEGVPDTVFYAAGFGGNFIVVDKANDLVIVTRWLEPDKIGELVEMVVGN